MIANFNIIMFTMSIFSFGTASDNASESSVSG